MEREEKKCFPHRAQIQSKSFPPCRFNNFFTDRQSNAGSRIFFSGVQPLENPEYPIVILGINPNSIVSNRNPPHLAFALGR